MDGIAPKLAPTFAMFAPMDGLLKPAVGGCLESVGGLVGDGMRSGNKFK